MGAAEPQLNQPFRAQRPANQAASHSSSRTKPPQGLYLHKPAEIKTFTAKWSSRFGNRSERKIIRQEWAQRRRVESVLILGIMLLLCLLVGVVTFHFVGDAKPELAAQASDTEPGSAIEANSFDLDQDTLPR